MKREKGNKVSQNQLTSNLVRNVGKMKQNETAPQCKPHPKFSCRPCRRPGNESPSLSRAIPHGANERLIRHGGVLYNPKKSSQW